MEDRKRSRKEKVLWHCGSLWYLFHFERKWSVLKPAFLNGLCELRVASICLIAVAGKSTLNRSMIFPWSNLHVSWGFSSHGVGYPQHPMLENHIPDVGDGHNGRVYYPAW